MYFDCTCMCLCLDMYLGPHVHAHAYFLISKQWLIWDALMETSSSNPLHMLRAHNPDTALATPGIGRVLPLAAAESAPLHAIETVALRSQRRSPHLGRVGASGPARVIPLTTSIPTAGPKSSISGLLMIAGALGAVLVATLVRFRVRRSSGGQGEARPLAAFSLLSQRCHSFHLPVPPCQLSGTTCCLYALSGNKVWPEEVLVEARPAPPKGEGVFALQHIDAAAFVCQYQGDVLTLEQQEERYPDKFPDYCLRVSDRPVLSVDGQNSGHWSRLINHNEHGNLKLYTDAAAQTAHFTAAQAIEAGEELSFDYGIAFFTFRGITPAAGTDSRQATLRRADPEDADPPLPPPPPPSPTEIRLVLCDEADSPYGRLSDREKKALFMRALDAYSGVRWLENGRDVELATDLRGSVQVMAFADVSVEHLANTLEALWNEAQTKTRSPG